MNTRLRNVAVAAIVVVVVVTGFVVGRELWRDAHRTGLSEAIDTVPESTLRLGFTDWAAVRRELAVPADARPTAEAVEKLAVGGYDTDLSAASSIDEATAALQEHFGFSPMTADWEAFAQSEEGAAMVLRMPDDFDLDRVTDQLEDLGFTEPSESTGVWQGGIDLVAAIDPTITPELQYVAVLADRHLIVTSDQEDYAKQAAEAALGDRDSLGDSASAREIVAKIDDPAAAMVWAGDFACSDLAMSQADDDSQDVAERLVSEAGAVSPLSGLVMAMGSDRTLTVAGLFEDSDQAKGNLRSRARLAVGEAPGRGGRFSDDLELVSSRTDGAAVLLELRPREQAGFVLSAVDNGPVLFATC